MNANNALHTGLRSLVFITLAALCGACGASPDGQSAVEEQVVTAPDGGTQAPEDSDPDAATPSSTPMATPTFGPVAPVENVEPGPGPGGIVPTHATHAPGMPHAQ
jgi:hypothetical protein